MLLTLIGLFSGLVVFGGIMSLAVAIDKHAAKKAPISFAVFFTGLGFWIVLLVSGMMFGALAIKGVMSEELAFAASLLIATVVGGGGGCIYGYHLGLARRRRYAHLDG